MGAPQHHRGAGRDLLYADGFVRDALRATEGSDPALQGHPEGREFTVAVVESGTVFGEMVLTGQRLRTSFAQAMEESEISAMCRADVERLILDKPEVGLQLVHLLSDRLLTYETRLEDMALKEVPTRLASLILLLIES
jgi:CRP/FNR family transcriptional regulator, cyclic AMP receptor protein